MNRPKKEMIALLIACMPAFFADNSYAGRPRDARRGRGTRVVSPAARSRQRVVVPAPRRPQPEIVQPEEQFVARPPLPVLPDLQEPQEEMSGVVSPQSLAQMSPQQRKEYIAQILEMASALDSQKNQDARTLEIERQKAEKDRAEQELARREQEIFEQEEAELRDLLNPPKKEEVKKEQAAPEKGKKLELVIKGAPAGPKVGMPKPAGIDVKTYAKLDNALKSAAEQIGSLASIVRQAKLGKIVMRPDTFLEQQRSHFNAVLRKIDFSAFFDEKLESMTDQQRKNVQLFVQRNIEKPYQELIDLFAHYIFEAVKKNETTDRQINGLMDLFEAANTKYLSLLQNCQLLLTDVQEKWDAHQLVDMKDKLIEERSKRIVVDSNAKESIVLKKDEEESSLDQVSSDIQDKIVETLRDFEETKNSFVAHICENLEKALTDGGARISQAMLSRLIQDFEQKRFKNLKNLLLTQRLFEDWAKKQFKIKEIPSETRKNIKNFEREIAKGIEQTVKACNETVKYYWDVKAVLFADDLKTNIKKTKDETNLETLRLLATSISTAIDGIKKKIDGLDRSSTSSPYRLECFNELRALSIEQYDNYVDIYNDFYDRYYELVEKQGRRSWWITPYILRSKGNAKEIPSKKQPYKK